MKKLFALLLCAVLILCLCACSSKPEEQANPYRPVSYRNEYFENGVLTSQDLTEYRYDEQGFQIEAVYYEDGMQKRTNLYENDAYGNVLKVTSITDTSANLYENKLTLDDQNRVLRQEEYVDGVLSSTMEYSYDNQGNIASEIYTIMEDGTVTHVRHREMTYDRKGNLLREICTLNDGSYIQYDHKDGRRVKSTRFEPNGEISQYWEYTYNDAGHPIKEASYTCETNGDTRTSRLSTYNLYTYDDTGLVVTKTAHTVEERPFLPYTVTTYDEYGNQLQLEKYQDGQLYWRISQEFELVP